MLRGVSGVRVPYPAQLPTFSSFPNSASYQIYRNWMELPSHGLPQLLDRPTSEHVAGGYSTLIPLVRVLLRVLIAGKLFAENCPRALPMKDL